MSTIDDLLNQIEKITNPLNHLNKYQNIGNTLALTKRVQELAGFTASSAMAGLLKSESVLAAKRATSMAIGTQAHLSAMTALDEITKNKYVGLAEEAQKLAGFTASSAMADLLKSHNKFFENLTLNTLEKIPLLAVFLLLLIH